MKLKIGLLSVTLMVCFLVATAQSAGPPHGTRAMSMGTAFVGVADDLSAITHNPAGLVLSKGSRVYGGLTTVVISSTYDTVSGGHESTGSNTFYPPHLYVSSDFGMPNAVVGLGILSPYGIGGRRWDSDGLTRYLSTENVFSTMSLNPTLSWEPFPGFSLGFGVSYVFSEVTSKNKVDQSMAGAGDAELKIEADGWDWGVNLGLLYRPNDFLSIGAAFRSKVEIRHKGDASLSAIAQPLSPLFGGTAFSTGVSSTITYPDIIDLGFAVRPREDLLLALDLEWIRWSRFERTDLDFNQEVPMAGFSDRSLIHDWDDALCIHVGLEYTATENLKLRCGYAYTPSQVPEYTFSPAAPDTDRHDFSAGFGYTWNDMTIDVSYMVGLSESQYLDAAVLPGTYDTLIHNIAIGIGYAF